MLYLRYFLSSTAPFEKSALLHRFNLEQTQVFYSYSYTKPIPEVSELHVGVFGSPKPEAATLWMAQDHSQSDIENRFYAGNAFGLSVSQGNQTVASCYVFQIHNQVLEIGGLHTLPSFRGKGLGKALVRRAVNEILAREKLPRYHVHSSNVASAGLAEGIGMTRFMTLEHLLATPKTV